MKHEASKRAFEAATRRMPGGVNSPARACRSVGAEPVFAARAEGAWVEDVDGQRYIDYVGAFGPMILGHAHPEVVARVGRAAARGFSFGMPTEAETALTERIAELVPAMERLRLVSSGTEATMSALRTARGYTGRRGIIKLEGCYHGHADALLVKAGSGALTHGSPDSAGVTPGAVADTFTAPYNDLDAVEAIFTAQPEAIAALIVEPVVGNMGVVPPEPGYLEGLRELTRRHGALLIFDEVMTGFRVALGGAQARFGVTPDMTCLGKIVGGGLPVGAYGGRADIMGVVAPEGPVYQAGTNSGNPLSVAAGLATLELLSHPGAYERLEALGARLEAGLTAALEDVGVEGRVQRVGSMLTLFFAPGPVRRLDDVPDTASARFGAFWRGMRDAGVLLPPSQYEAWFVSLAHDEAICDRTVEAARQALAAQ
ncbi:MAG: glutamate-1-semialdehyde 2,1-aminomutase [Deltaproteobacteria bacterium]|nr:glutamate-1-semialdehyde 2,1-aminomutase [Deltaproteobacteria bacterium]MCB9786402.1 glutamate-1-semialdehyde 2,1-aminomutase [Deltaproteobacteria bacterium]